MAPKVHKEVRARLAGFWLMLVATLNAAANLLVDSWATAQRRAKRFAADKGGFMNMSAVWVVISVVVLAVIIIQVLAKLAPTFITSVADLVNAIETKSFNDTTANALRPIFGLLIALLGLLALVGLAFKAFGGSEY